MNSTKVLSSRWRKAHPDVKVIVRTERVPGRKIVMIYIHTPKTPYPRIGILHEIGGDEEFTEKRINQAVKHLKELTKCGQQTKSRRNS